MEVTILNLQAGSSSYLADALPAKVGKLVNQALTKAWVVENVGQIAIVQNMVTVGNFVAVWNFFRKYRRHHHNIQSYLTLYIYNS